MCDEWCDTRETVAQKVRETERCVKHLTCAKRGNVCNACCATPAKRLRNAAKLVKRLAKRRVTRVPCVRRQSPAAHRAVMKPEQPKWYIYM